MSSIINASIDLSKIDKSKIYEKDGRKWLSLQISVNDNLDNYGNNASVSIGQSKEEREAKTPKIYLGNGKVTWTDGNIYKAELVQKATNLVQGVEQQNIEDDLPF